MVHIFKALQHKNCLVEIDSFLRRASNDFEIGVTFEVIEKNS